MAVFRWARLVAVPAYVGDGDLSVLLVILAIIALAAAVYFAVVRRFEAALVALLVGVVILVLA